LYWRTIQYYVDAISRSSTKDYCETSCRIGFGSRKKTPVSSKRPIVSTTTALAPSASPKQPISKNARCGAERTFCSIQHVETSLAQVLLVASVFGLKEKEAARTRIDYKQLRTNDLHMPSRILQPHLLLRRRVYIRLYTHSTPRESTP
jgi:hypothetical protein